MREGTSPAPDWEVRFDTSGLAAIETKTNQIGKYQVILPKAGHYSVRLTQSQSGTSVAADSIELVGAGMKTRDFEVPIGVLVLELNFPPGVGKPGNLSERQFSISNEDASRSGSSASGSKVIFQSVAPGTFELSSYAIRVGSTSYILGGPTSLEFHGGKEPQVFQVQMVLGCTIEGAVANVPAGTLSFSVYLFSREAGHNYVDSARAQNGVFRMSGLVEGEYWISTVYGDGKAHPRRRVHLKSGSVSNVIVPYQTEPED